MIHRVIVVFGLMTIWMPVIACAAESRAEGHSWAEVLGATEPVNLVCSLAPEEQGQLNQWIEGLESPNANLVKNQIVTMGSSAVPTLVQRLDEAKVGQGQQIIEVLGRIGDRRALPVLLEYVESDNKWFRCAAVYAVGRIAGDEAIPLLIDSLQDEAQAVSINAIQMLAVLGDPKSIPHLIEMVRKPNPVVSTQAATALVRMSNGMQNHGRDWISWQMWYDNTYGSENKEQDLLGGFPAR